jgi:hypothetical protein
MSYIPTAIKSIQYGTVTIAGAAASGTATITSVTVNSSVVMMMGYKNADASNLGTGSTPSGLFAHVVLTDPTTVTATRFGTPGTSLLCPFIVVEFLPNLVKTRQTGTITIATGAQSNTASITAVVLNKAFMPYQGFLNKNTNTLDTTNPQNNFFGLTLTNTTTITAANGGLNNVADTIIPYTVLEFR